MNGKFELLEKCSYNIIYIYIKVTIYNLNLSTSLVSCVTKYYINYVFEYF